jgi:glycosyltransferase involved in cell wall biosynthesis
MTAEMLDHRFVRSDSAALRPLRWLETRIDRAADAVITSSHNAEAALRERINDRSSRITTVADAVNTETFAPPANQMEQWARTALRASFGIPPEQRVVVYLGLLAPYQGTDLLLEAASIMYHEWAMRDVHFLVMGFPGVDSYRDQATRLGLDGVVTFPGRIPYPDAPRYLALGDVAVAPKLSATEGAGKIGNYMAMGLPVVTFDTPISHEYLGALGVYARRGDSRSLAARLRQVLDNSEQYRYVGNKLGQRAAQDLSWDSAIERIEEVYREAALRRSGKLSEKPQAQLPAADAQVPVPAELPHASSSRTGPAAQAAVLRPEQPQPTAHR